MAFTITDDDGQPLTFQTEERYNQYVRLHEKVGTTEQREPLSKNAEKQARSRKRHKRAFNFWKVRITTGSTPLTWLEGISDKVIACERKNAMNAFAGLVALYPERAEILTK